MVNNTKVLVKFSKKHERIENRNIDQFLITISPFYFDV